LSLAPVAQRRARGATRATSNVLSMLSSLVVIALALWLAYTLIGDGVAWVQQKVDDLRYGYPRTFQTDAFLGYGESGGVPTHFMALNLHGQISVFIVDGADPARVRVLRGPVLLGDGRDLVAPLLRVVDVNHDGHPDLLLSVNGQDFTYLNVPAAHTFRLLQPAAPASTPASTGAGSHGG
jgi:hypothetical protein